MAADPVASDDTAVASGAAVVSCVDSTAATAAPAPPSTPAVAARLAAMRRDLLTVVSLLRTPRAGAVTPPSVAAETSTTRLTVG